MYNERFAHQYRGKPAPGFPPALVRRCSPLLWPPAVTTHHYLITTVWNLVLRSHSINPEFHWRERYRKTNARAPEQSRLKSPLWPPVSPPHCGPPLWSSAVLPRCGHPMWLPDHSPTSCANLYVRRTTRVVLDFCRRGVTEQVHHNSLMQSIRTAGHHQPRPRQMHFKN